MAKFQLREAATIEAFVVQDVSPEFHGYQLALLDNGDVDMTLVGTPVPGDYFDSSDGTFVGRDAFEAKYVPLAG